MREGNSVCVFPKACVPGLKKPQSFCVVDRKWWKFGSLDPVSRQVVGENVDEFRETRIEEKVGEHASPNSPPPFPLP